VSTPLENLSRYFANEPAIRFSGWNGRSMAEAVLTLLDLPAKERQAMGRSAASRVAAQLDWCVIAANAADFIETTTSHSKSGLSKTCCQSSAPV
jgi:glycosyltransferase involved in cell wall biosynthesis